MLIVGAGKVAELVAQNLASRGGVEIVVANRSRERGAALADRFNGTCVPLDRLAEAIQREGGMRKIRDYVTREARRVRELVEPA